MRPLEAVKVSVKVDVLIVVSTRSRPLSSDLSLLATVEEVVLTLRRSATGSALAFGIFSVGAFE